MIYQPMNLDRLYGQAVDHSLNELIESGKIDSGLTSYEHQCEFRRKSIKRFLKSRLGKSYSEDDFWAWSKTRYRCGW